MEMKNLIVIAGLAVAALTMSFTHTTKALFSWEKTDLYAGEIPQGVPHEVTFTFTNTGDAPLVITRTQGSCGCTASAYTEEAIAPGAQGWVRATYNAAKVGAFNKTVTVYSNVEGEPTVLRLRGEVVSQE